MRHHLKTRQIQVLEQLRDGNYPIEVRNSTVNIGGLKTCMNMVHKLLHLCLINDLTHNSNNNNNNAGIYQINEEGLKALRTGYVDRHW